SDLQPEGARRLDDAAVGEELLQVAANRPIVGPLRRAEIDDQHADPAARDGRMTDRPRDRRAGGEMRSVHAAGVKFVATPLMQYRRPVGGGPSGNTWPRCEPQRAQCTSVRLMPHESSTVLPSAPATGEVKLGQPVPLSNLVVPSNKGWPQPAQLNTPGRFSERRAQLPGRSVACSRMIEYCSGVSRARHSASVWVTGNCSWLIAVSLANDSSLCRAPLA